MRRWGKDRWELTKKRHRVWSSAPELTIKRQIANTFDVLVQQNRLEDGSRHVISICTLGGVDKNGEYSIVEQLNKPGPLRKPSFLARLRRSRNLRSLAK